MHTTRGKGSRQAHYSSLDRPLCLPLPVTSSHLKPAPAPPDPGPYSMPWVPWHSAPRHMLLPGPPTSLSLHPAPVPCPRRTTPNPLQVDPRSMPRVSDTLTTRPTPHRTLCTAPSAPARRVPCLAFPRTTGPCAAPPTHPRPCPPSWPSAILPTNLPLHTQLTQVLLALRSLYARNCSATHTYHSVASRAASCSSWPREYTTAGCVSVATAVLPSAGRGRQNMRKRKGAGAC